MANKDYKSQGQQAGTFGKDKDKNRTEKENLGKTSSQKQQFGKEGQQGQSQGQGRQSSGLGGQREDKLGQKQYGQQQKGDFEKEGKGFQSGMGKKGGQGGGSRKI